MLLMSLGVLVQMVALVPPDGAEILRDARAAQSRFERIRRSNLPLKLSSVSGSHCDAVIGRYCYWYDSTDTDAEPEPARITAAREALLAHLQSALGRNPTDGWIVGQQTRYLIEAGRWRDAAYPARACAGEPWWCAALKGLALHVGERYAEADSAFAIALAGMPEAQRCAWLTLQHVLDGDLARELSRGRCKAREALMRRVSVLSKPLWLTPGNDFWTEHFARHTMAAILEESANGHGMSWGDDSRELLMRYGWSDWYTRHSRTSSMYFGMYDITGHSRGPSFFFVPEVSSVRMTPRLTPATWRLREERAPMRYAPKHVKGMTTLPHQLARFPHGDSMVVAAAFRVPATDTLLARDDTIEAGITVLQDAMRRVKAEGRPFVLTPTKRDTLIASIEVYGKSSRRAARARYTVDPLPCRGKWCLSDLLLTDGTLSDSARTREDALAAALTDFRWPVNSPVGVYWEIQKPSSATPVWFSLTVTPVRVSLARRVATRLRLAPELSPVRLRWEGVLRESTGVQFVSLRLPPNARGRYRVLLTVEARGAPPLTASREIEVLDQR